MRPRKVIDMMALFAMLQGGHVTAIQVAQGCSDPPSLLLAYKPSAIYNTIYNVEDAEKIYQWLSKSVPAATEHELFLRMKKAYEQGK